jgi:CRISPR system Cascade subunit CasD
MGVRVDREGAMRMDYHTAGGHHTRAERDYGVALFGGSGTDTALSFRSYLADADFLVGLEARGPGQEELLDEVDRALARPIWPLFLGRKAFPPGVPVRLPDAAPLGPGLRSEGLREVLLGYPWPEERQSRVRLVIEEAAGTSGELRMDVPVSFAPLDRRYAPRYVRSEFLTWPVNEPASETEVE